MKPWQNLATFILIILVGYFIERRIARAIYKDRKFRLSRYFLVLFFPLTATAFATYQVGIKALYVFIVSAGIGCFLEYKLNSAYSAVVGKRLWKYYKYNINSNTSPLCIPLWGMAGVMFLLIARTFL
ncbi:hypothetical protein HYW35_04290 [Candidatus Saccharibacteria bacterium]|nr:hypothetical protein [Candidatus Saccharibacteria bacterium]